MVAMPLYVRGRFAEPMRHGEEDQAWAGESMAGGEGLRMEVMRMERRGDGPSPEMTQGTAAGAEAGAVSPPQPPGGEKKRRKVSLITAIVVNVVTLIIVAIILLAVLLPGYRRSFTVVRAVRGAEEVWIVVRTSESRMRENSTDFIRAQDGLRNVLQEEVGGGGDNVRAYVRDNFPDQAWVQENLPDNMREWLEQLFPKPETGDEGQNPGRPTGNGQEPSAESSSAGTGQGTP